MGLHGILGWRQIGTERLWIVARRLVAKRYSKGFQGKSALVFYRGVGI